MSAVDFAGIGYSVAEEVVVVVVELKEFPPVDAGASAEADTGIPAQAFIRAPAQWFYAFIHASEYFSTYSPRAPPRIVLSA